VRRAAAATGLAAACLVALAVTDHLVGGVASGQAWRIVADLAVLLLGVALVPVAVRVLAHPGATGLPARSGVGATAGLVGALGCVVVGFVATMVGRLAGETVESAPIAGRLLLVTTAVLTLLATAVAAGRLRDVRAGTAVRRADLPGRPDLFDDLALLSARSFPGSPAARALAWGNRGLDRWAWSPRRARSPLFAANRRVLGGARREPVV
jgi:hypothetical protein